MGGDAVRGVDGRDQELARAFGTHRAHLVGVAYRLTGSRADAEDAVQDAWLRLSRLGDAELAEVRDLRGWLTTTVGRLCVDRLRSAQRRRERYVGQWLPEPLVTTLEGGEDDPLASVVRADGVRMAAMVVLDELTPEQRVAGVLHDAFGVPFDEVAATLGCAPATARQHAVRGRRTMAAADPPPRAALVEQREVLDRFLVALRSGDVVAVTSLLHPDVRFISDGGGRARTALRVVVGAEKVARLFLGLLRRHGTLPVTAGRAVLVNGDLGMMLAAGSGWGGRDEPGGRVTSFAIRDGLVLGVYEVVNPEKLVALPR
ncbi:RNA polymerase sigma factor SigJ [Actinoalloteichus caeruleus]|uniref:RNA polymerase sigma factor SigJ n=1 Tax=Actinoalloteichus cyanogriseus TaxID=2893586 RepID=UPI00068E2A32|nr:RNA polymerase sigma factor SigJ [Actinoalloteichus caeruleus]